MVSILKIIVFMSCTFVLYFNLADVTERDTKWEVTPVLIGKAVNLVS